MTTHTDDLDLSVLDLSVLDLSVVIPAFNEEACVASVLDDVVATLAGSTIARWEIVVVDDGSRDATAAQVDAYAAREPRVRLLRHERNRGQGAALATGFSGARGRWVAWLPADGQIPSAELLAIWAATPAADFVTTHYRRRDDGLVRAALSATLSSMIWVALRVWAFNGGVFAFRRELWQRSPARTDSMLLGVEFRHRLRGAGVRYHAVPIDCVPRRAGTSKSANLRTIARTFRALVRIRLS